MDLRALEVTDPALSRDFFGTSPVIVKETNISSSLLHHHRDRISRCTHDPSVEVCTRVILTRRRAR
jgi:hypothetical protein